MTRILLARHGESLYNRDGIIQGQRDVDLSETGLAQARRLAERLQDEDIDAIYCSDLQRARKTAEFVASYHDATPQPLPALRERSWGELEDASRDEFAQALDAHDGGRKTFAPGDAETFDDVWDRTLPALNRFRTDHRGETVVVVAHGGVNRTLLMAALGTDSGHGHRIHQDNTGLNELVYDDRRGWQVRRVNDTHHLGDA